MIWILRQLSSQEWSIKGLIWNSFINNIAISEFYSGKYVTRREIHVGLTEILEYYCSTCILKLIKISSRQSRSPPPGSTGQKPEKNQHWLISAYYCPKDTRRCISEDEKYRNESWFHWLFFLKEASTLVFMAFQTWWSFQRQKTWLLDRICDWNSLPHIKEIECFNP